MLHTSFKLIVLEPTQKLGILMILMILMMIINAINIFTYYTGYYEEWDK